ncbi:MAG: hypothetical protein ACRDDY_14690 [Clostridium sp.]|uniref:hypothetical protein n=1 Tax=Clostridium sp. TaxID=1506 RepID=UPI003EE73DB5
MKYCRTQLNEYVESCARLAVVLPTNYTIIAAGATNNGAAREFHFENNIGYDQYQPNHIRFFQRDIMAGSPISYFVIAIKS